MNINQHVVRRKSGWAVVGEGNQRDTFVLATQAAAVAKARQIARNQGSTVVVHRLIQTPEKESAILQSQC